jgi:hypothetical protein
MLSFAIINVVLVIGRSTMSGEFDEEFKADLVDFVGDLAVEIVAAGRLITGVVPFQEDSRKRIKYRWGELATKFLNLMEKYD